MLYILISHTLVIINSSKIRRNDKMLLPATFIGEKKNAVFLAISRNLETKNQFETIDLFCLFQRNKNKNN